MLFEIVAGISSWSVVFFYRYLDRFLWSQEKCIKLGVSVSIFTFLSNYLNSTILPFFECTLSDCLILEKFFLLYTILMGLFFVLFETAINALILFLMLNIYDKIAKRE